MPARWTYDVDFVTFGDFDNISKRNAGIHLDLFEIIVITLRSITLINHMVNVDITDFAYDNI